MSETIKDRPLARGIRETAEIVGVSASFIRKVINSGELRVTRLGRRVLIRDSDLLEWLDAGQGDQRQSSNPRLEQPKSEPADPARTEIEQAWRSFEIGVRLYNCLKEMGVSTFKEAADFTDRQLLCRRRFGLKTLRDLDAALNQRGLSRPRAAETLTYSRERYEAVH